MQDLETKGRDLSVKMLTQAVENSSDVNEFNRQLYTLDCCAINIIATNIFNRVKALGENKIKLIMEAKDLIEAEVEMLIDNADQVETVAIKTK